jgi:hypothetical protein
MNRGCYDFPNEEEKSAWETMVGWVIERMLSESYPEEWDLTNRDISPFLLGKCIETHGWEWDYTCREREDCWDYYYHSDYTNKMLCIYTDSNTFKLTLDIYDKEEE